jgi:hypothetical protein
MYRIGLDTVGLGIVVVTLVSLMFAVLVMQRQRSGKTIAIWLAAGFVGILLGSALTLGALRFSGFRKMDSLMATSVPGSLDEGPPALVSTGDMGPAVGGSERGMGGSPGGGMGGPNPKRELTTLVRKIALLTGDVGIKLSSEQAQSLSAVLVDVESAQEISDDDAKAKHDEILALLDDAQKSQLDTVGLPRPPRGAGGGPPSAAPPNPFQDEQNAAALKNLRRQLGSDAS